MCVLREEEREGYSLMKCVWCGVERGERRMYECVVMCVCGCVVCVGVGVCVCCGEMRARGRGMNVSVCVCADERGERRGLYECV